MLERYYFLNEVVIEELVDKGLLEVSEFLEVLENYYFGDNLFLCGFELIVVDSYVVIILC